MHEPSKGLKVRAVFLVKFLDEPLLVVADLHPLSVNVALDPLPLVGDRANLVGPHSRSHLRPSFAVPTVIRPFFLSIDQACAECGQRKDFVLGLTLER